MTATPFPSEHSSRPVARSVVATAVAGTVLIAVGAFWLSFTALTDLAERAGIPAGQAWVWPLIVDGVIVVATVSVVALAPQGRRATVYPWSLLVAGAVVSVSGNAVHATVAAAVDVPVVLAAVIASVPPVVLLAITHLTVELTRTRTPTCDTVDLPATDLPSAAGAQPAPRIRSRPRRSAAASVKSVSDRRSVAEGHRRAGWSNKRIARELGVHPSTVGRWLAHPSDVDEADADRDGADAPAGRVASVASR